MAPGKPPRELAGAVQRLPAERVLKPDAAGRRRPWRRAELPGHKPDAPGRKALLVAQQRLLAAGRRAELPGRKAVVVVVLAQMASPW